MAANRIAEIGSGRRPPSEVSQEEDGRTRRWLDRCRKVYAIRHHKEAVPLWTGIGSGHGFHRRRLAGALEHDHIEVYVKVTRDGDYFVFHALTATRYRVEIGKEARKMTVRITAKDQAIMDEMVGEADRGELIFNQEAALRREPGGPALSDEELGAIMTTGLQRLGAQGDEDQTT